MAARFVNWSMATPNCAEPGRPMVSTVSRARSGIDERSRFSGKVCGEDRAGLRIDGQSGGVDADVYGDGAPDIRIEGRDYVAAAGTCIENPLFAVPVITVGSNTIPVVGAVTLPVAAVVLRTGVLAPMSMAPNAPCGAEPLSSSSYVTTARPWLLVPRSGSIATAVGSWKPPMLTAVPARVVTEELQRADQVNFRNSV